MNQLENKLVKLAFTAKTNIDFEKQMNQLIYQEVSQTVKHVFERIDGQLIANTKAQGYKIERKDSRTIQFAFGDVEFSRRLYKQGKKSLYALDEYLGFVARQRYSPLMQMKITQLTSKGEFKKVSEAINILTPLSVSAHGVHQITQRVSLKIKDHEANKKELVLEEKKKVPILFLEGDALLIKNRSKNGNFITIHRYQVHEGIRKKGKRSECINKHLTSNSSRKKAFKDMLDYLHNHYDLSNTIILSCSDGGSGYDPEVFFELALGCKQHEHFLDRYHLIRKLEERAYFCEPELVDKLKQAIFEYSEEKLARVLDTIESVASTEEESSKAIEYVKLLRNYLKRNWKYIKPIRLRTLAGISNNKGLGVFESNHRPFSYRMKKQGRAWSKKGAENMVRVINSIINGEFEEAIKSDWEQEIEKLDNVEIDMEKLMKDEFKEHEIKTVNIVNCDSNSSSFGRIKKSIIKMKTN